MNATLRRHSMKTHRSGGDTTRALLKTTPVATAVAAMLFGIPVAQAQTADGAAPQVITVTGIRKGIEAAISVKKNSDSIVEAISAEDIGKLPDLSVAESVSRLPGVTIQLSPLTGRAQQVSVRGMSPDFNGGLLNGREQASTGIGRGVEFDQYPAELLGGIVIYKTPDATLVGQGLSSTIDLQMVRPLNFGKRTVAVNYRKEQSTKAEARPGFGTGSGDRASLSYVDQFADRTIGVALGLTKQKIKGGGRPNFNTWGGWVQPVEYPGYPIVKDAKGDYVSGGLKTPGGFTTDIETTDFDRTGAMAVLQYKPNKDFESILDIFYSKGNFSVKKRGLEGPLGGLSAGANDTGGTLINATISGGVATAGTFTNWKGVIRNHNEDYTDELTSVGWGNRFKAGTWRMNADLSYSSVKKDSVRYETTAGLPGNTTNNADTISYTGFNGSNLAEVKYTSGLNYADPNIIKLTDVQGWAGGAGVQDGYYANPVTTDKIKALRLSGKHDVSWGPVVSVDVGANLTNRSKDRVATEGALVVIGGLNPDGTVRDRLISANVPSPTVGVGGLTGIPTLNWNPAGSLGSIYQLNQWTVFDIASKSWGVDEKVTTGYIKGDIDGSLGGLDVRGNVGLQLQRTQQSASGFRVDQASCVDATKRCTYLPMSADHSFTDVLPNLNLSTRLGADSVVRLGIGRVLARPNMEDMKASFEFSLKTDVNPQYIKGGGGNPKLEPFRADAIDLSFEKYFGSKGYISIAGFNKSLKTYILNVNEAFDFSPYITPASVLPPSGNKVGVFTKPINGSGGSIRGVELSVNVPLSLVSTMLDGFGLMVNYSNTSSSVSLPASGFATQNVRTTTIPLPGLSKQVTNLRAYYEKHGFQFAVAARKRSDFLGSINDYQDRNQLVYVKGSTNIDFQALYEFSQGALKGLSILAQGSNLTNPWFEYYDAANGQTTDRKKFGKSYLVGANYKF
ncbi:MAG: TonB-dependent receptor [Leptothrix sp. (in: Bacteria)]|nr:TonB-dependent receptor [Leptothrix sp. (in: b-proteobacteria)]